MQRKSAAIVVTRRGAATGALAQAYQRVAGREREPANILAVSSVNPRSMEDHARLYRGLMFGPSPLSRLERELVAAVVSRANDCHY